MSIVLNKKGPEIRGLYILYDDNIPLLLFRKVIIEIVILGVHRVHFLFIVWDKYRYSEI